MTGIERLREFVDGVSPITAVCGVTKIEYDREHAEEVGGRLRDFLSGIADQIKREHAEDCFRMGKRAAEDAEAIAWVREHGGFDELARMYQDADNRRVELCGALGIDLDKGWSEAMAAMRLRLMPEGMEWPRFEDGEPVRPGDKLLDENGEWFEAISFVFTCDWWSARGYQTEGFGDLNAGTRRKLGGMAYGTRVKRPAPKVLDADGVEIRKGDTVWTLKDARRLEVTGLYPEQSSYPVKVKEHKDGASIFSGIEPTDLTHRAPVLAADGRPLREGEHVWHVETGTKLVVRELPKPGGYQAVMVFAPPASHLTSFDPDRLTHERPDSWERLEEDVRKTSCVYFSPELDGCDGCPARQMGESCITAKERDLVRRARALAGDA